MDMSNMTRHVGKMAKTDQRVVVAYMQLEERSEHALVIPVDSLTPRMEQAVMDLLKTPEGQQSMPFATALHRHKFPDTGESILESLHRQRILQKVNVNDVIMLPIPNQPIKLSDILQQQGKLPVQIPSEFETEKFNPHLHNHQLNSSENKRAIARGLLVEAEMLEAEAKKKRNMAYEHDASLHTHAPRDASPWTSVPSDQLVSLDSVNEMYESKQQELTSKIDDVKVDDRLDRLELMLTTLMEKIETPVSSETVVKKPKKVKDENVSA